MNKRTKRETGFSLIEVLVALVVLAVGLLALASLQITAIRGNFISSHLMEATYLVQSRIEEMKGLPFNDNLLIQGNHEDEMVVRSGISFDRQYAITDDTAGYKLIDYTVTWNDGSKHQISFSTIRSQ